jgi:hypothetical protein
MRSLTSLAGLALGLGLPTPASAATITVSFAGTASFVASALASGFAVGARSAGRSSTARPWRTGCGVTPSSESASAP